MRIGKHDFDRKYAIKANIRWVERILKCYANRALLLERAQSLYFELF